MRYSVLGFNQAKVIEANLDIIDLFILQYIQQACGSTTMSHRLDENENPQVWVSHAKLISDLPILNISEGTLKNRLSSLNKNGYISVTIVRNVTGRGSRAYYGLTDNAMQLMYSDATTSLQNDVVERPRHAGVTSDSKLISDSKGVFNTKVLNTGENEDNSETKSKSKGLNFYQKCVKYTEEYTDDEDIRKVLFDFLNMLVKNGSLHGNANNWLNKLKKLETYDMDKNTIIQMVQMCIDRGYSGFFNLTSTGSNTLASCESNVRCDRMTVDDMKKQEDFINKLREKGERVEF